MRNTSSLKKILILVTVLAVPGFLYYLLQEKGKNRYRPLEIFGPKQVASTFHTKRGVKIPDTIYHHIRDFKLLSATGDSVAIPSDSSHIAVVNFFFTTCKTACKAMNSQVSRMASIYTGNKMLRFYSISVDPEHDTPEVLNAYAKTIKADPKQWFFLTGDKNLIYTLAKKDFLVDVLPGMTATDSIIHSQILVLIDSNKRIRGFYDSSSKQQMNKLNDEITVQITEELRNNPSLISGSNYE